MKNKKKMLESVILAAFALVVIISAAVNGNTDITVEHKSEDTVAEDMVATKERADAPMVAAGDTEESVVEDTEEVADETAEEVVEEVAEEPVVEEVSEWATRLMPSVEESLNIRAEADTEAEVVGKLYKGAVADILERGEEWTKISSGNVEGFVKNEYCVFDEAAEAMAYEQGTVYATALTGGVRVRANASAEEDSTIMDVLEEGGKIKVNTDAEAPEGWVAVICFDQTAYVSAEYVSVELELKKAVSIEEELAAIRAAQEAKAKRQSTRTQKSSVDASYDDVTLLGALIQCEAGSECYEGQVAVGAVVMNRLRSGYAGSISGVIYQSGQFTPASSGALARALANGVSGSCIQAAQEALSGVDNVCGATSFRRAGRAEGIVIGNHVFF